MTEIRLTEHIDLKTYKDLEAKVHLTMYVALKMRPDKTEKITAKEYLLDGLITTRTTRPCATSMRRTRQRWEAYRRKTAHTSAQITSAADTIGVQSRPSLTSMTLLPRAKPDNMNPMLNRRCHG